MEAGGQEPDGLDEQVAEALARLEERAGKQLGDPEDPLLVSVRSGARESMPGMLDTVLNLGLNDESVEGLARATGNERFAWDSYRRFVQMFGNVVHGRPRRALRGRDQARQGRARGQARHRARRRRAARADRARSRASTASDRRGLPAGAARAARARRSARCSTPGSASAPCSTGASTASPTTGARRSTSSRWSSATRATTSRLGRRLQPRRGHRRARALRRLPRQRPGRGRRLRRAQHPGHRRARRRHARGPRAAHGDPAHARGPLQGHAGHGVHGRGGAPLHAPDAQRQAPRAGGGALRGGRGGRGAARQGARRSQTIDAEHRSTRCCTRPSTPARTTSPRQRRGRLAGRGQGRDRLHRARRGGGRGARDAT